MRMDLLGLALEDALVCLANEGISAQVTMTSAPRRRDEQGGVLRVVYAEDDGSKLTAARFFDPIADETEE